MRDFSKVVDSQGDRTAPLRWLARLINAAMIGLLIGSFTLPDPRHLLTITFMALPWIFIVLVARYQPFYYIGGVERDGAHVNFSQILAFPGLALLMHVLIDFHVLNWKSPVLLACTGSVLLMTAAFVADPSLRARPMAALPPGLLLGMYGYGAGMDINALVDPGPSVYKTTVVRKEGGRNAEVDYLVLAPWGPIQKAEYVRVSGARFEATQAGDTVCMYFGAGALRVPWYQVRDCPKSL
jgi:hypothetical protein